MSNQFNLAYATDLNEGLKVVPILPVFISGDDQAHCFIISANRSGKEEPLTGATVRGYFIRPDDVTVTLDGSVNDEGQAVLSPNSACYKKQGRFHVFIRATIGGVKSTVFCGEGRILLSATDSFIDEEGIVPSLDDLLAQVERIESAANNANTAADRANAAAERAENAKGETGATPNLTIGTVETLAAGSNATATITGTAEDPVLSLGIPKGYDGVGAVLSVNGKTGAVVLTADDVGYPVGAVYISAKPDSPASLFGGTWERLKDRFLLGAGDTYAAGTVGGEATHKLTASEIPAHTHNVLVGTTGTSGDQCVAITNSTNRSYVATTSVGSGAAHNNMPPYKVYYMWERVA